MSSVLRSQEHESRILVVEDEAAVMRLVALTLERHGYGVVAVPAGGEAIRLFQQQAPALMVLDLNLGDMSGFDVCRLVRQHSAVPIVVVSARTATEDKLSAFQLGADDYLTKPFDLREFLARIQAVLRRASSREARSLFRCGVLVIDLAARRVTRSQQEVRCTPIEFDLLRVLVQNAGAVVTHPALLREVWGPEYGNEREYLRVHLSHLRHKLEPGAARPTVIETIPRVGYRFNPDTEAADAAIAAPLTC